jgi:transposase
MVPGRRLNIGEALQGSPPDQNPNWPTRAVVFERPKMKRPGAGGRIKSAVSKRGEAEGLPVVVAGAAGIDLGSEEHWVCAPTWDGSGREVAKFGATTPELEKMAEWLRQRKVQSVALESTGVYWIAPHEVLERNGLDVLLVNTRDLARVPGRKKTDRIDCKWIQRLHSCGLLPGSFRPSEAVCMLRTLVRDKGTLAAEAGDWLRRMQKSMDQMNVRVHRAVSDIDGMTGMGIIRAIVEGARDPHRLAQLRNRRCQKSENEIAEQLSGNWRQDHWFSLGQALKMYDSIQQRIGEYEAEILHRLADMEKDENRGQQAPPLSNGQKSRSIRSRGEEPLRQALYRMSGWI